MAKMKMLIEAKRGNKWDEFHAMQDGYGGDEEMEEGEAEMEEGENEFIEMEGEDEDEDEFVSDNEDGETEKIPKAIPIAKDTVGINHATKSE